MINLIITATLLTAAAQPSIICIVDKANVAIPGVNVSFRGPKGEPIGIPDDQTDPRGEVKFEFPPGINACRATIFKEGEVNTAVYDVYPVARTTFVIERRATILPPMSPPSTCCSDCLAPPQAIYYFVPRCYVIPQCPQPQSWAAPNCPTTTQCPPTGFYQSRAILGHF